MHSRKAVGRLYVNKAQMISIGNALTEQLGEATAVRHTCTHTLRDHSSGCAAALSST